MAQNNKKHQKAMFFGRVVAGFNMNFCEIIYILGTFMNFNGQPIHEDVNEITYFTDRH